MIKKGSVHVVCLNNIDDQNFWCIPSELKNSQVSIAIKNGIPEYVRDYHEKLKAWFITYEGPHDEVLINAIPESKYCNKCLDWLDGVSDDLCPVWDDAKSLLQDEYNYLIFRPEEEPEERKIDYMDLITKIAKGAMEIAGPEINELARFARERAKVAIARNLSTLFKFKVSEELIDRLFEEISKNMAKPKAQRMQPEEAAHILKCRWPCSKSEVTEAFRLRVQQTHPDKPGGSTEEFIRVNLAKQTLLDAL